MSGSNVLTINGGSSSIEFAVFSGAGPPIRGLYGYIDRIGLPGSKLTFINPVTRRLSTNPVDATDQLSVVNFLIDWLENNPFSIR